VPGRIRAALLILFNSLPRPQLLDLGAGTGRIGRAFVSASDEYVGVDLSLGMLREFARRAAPKDGRAPRLVQTEAARYGLNHKTVAKWRKRAFVNDAPMGPKTPHSTVLSFKEKAIIVAFLNAYNFAKRLKTLRGLTPYEYICKAWADQPRRFRYDPTRLTSGLNT
jgi:hypothetical protein